MLKLIHSLLLAICFPLLFLFAVVVVVVVVVCECPSPPYCGYITTTTCAACFIRAIFHSFMQTSHSTHI